MTPYNKMEDDAEAEYHAEDEDEHNKEDDNMSDLYNISMAEAVEDQCDVRRAFISASILITIGVIIFLAIYFKNFLMDQLENFLEIMIEYPLATSLIY